MKHWRFHERKQLDANLWAYAFRDTRLTPPPAPAVLAVVPESPDEAIFFFSLRSALELPWKRAVAVVHNEYFGTKVSLKPTDAQVELMLDALSRASREAPTDPAPPIEPCRRCTECEGQAHHWGDLYAPVVNEELLASFGCKHCPALGEHCGGCGGPIPNAPVGCDRCGDTGVELTGYMSEDECRLSGHTALAQSDNEHRAENPEVAGSSPAGRHYPEGFQS